MPLPSVSTLLLVCLLSSVPVAQRAPSAQALPSAHPRVLFGPEDVPRLRRFYRSDDGAPFREALLRYLPVCRAPKGPKPRFLRDATDGQRQGYWRLPTVALHFVLTGERQSFERAKGYLDLLLALEHWELGGERDCGMSAANVMIGAGLALDWLWNELDPEFREKFRAKCLLHAKRMYEGGHQKGVGKTHYWQSDPANNHRWHRNAGLASCLLAAAGDDDTSRELLARFAEEMEFVVRWLPHDGTSHESPGYLTFGISHLVLAATAADRCLGTKHLEHDYFRNVADFRVQSFLPGLAGVFPFGDQGGVELGELGYDVALYQVTGKHGRTAAQRVLDSVRNQSGVGWGWMGIVYCDPDVSKRAAEPLPSSAFFADLGLLWSRESQERGAGAVQFKCGPFGGRMLNRFRNENGYRYINVAHDDPDANSFLLWRGGRFLAETDRYSGAKRSSHHNTILINGIGQETPGRREGAVWSQPARGRHDMTRMAFVTAVKLAPDLDLIEGEAGGSYLATKRSGERAARPALERFRRALVHVKGRYVLVLDDIRAPVPVRVSWLVQGPELEASEGDRSWLLRAGNVACPFRVASNRGGDLRASIVTSPADHRKKVLGWKQLRLETETEHLVVASVFALHGGEIALELQTHASGRIDVHVRSAEGRERWAWTPAERPDEAYRLEGSRGGQVFATLGPSDRPE